MERFRKIPVSEKSAYVRKEEEVEVEEEEELHQL